MKVLVKAEAKMSSNSDVVLVRIDRGRQLCEVEFYVTPDMLIELPPHDLVDREELLAEYDRQHVGPPGGARKIMEQATAVIKAEEME